MSFVPSGKYTNARTQNSPAKEEPGTVANKAAAFRMPPERANRFNPFPRQGRTVRRGSSASWVAMVAVATDASSRI